ncbi:unnamed protein product, partial [Rotaria socialis]
TSMATTAVTSKTKATDKNTGSASATNDTPITEEELKKKELITVSDVLRLRKSTTGISYRCNGEFWQNFYEK